MRDTGADCCAWDGIVGNSAATIKSLSQSTYRSLLLGIVEDRTSNVVLA
jgi:hypothetical protein